MGNSLRDEMKEAIAKFLLNKKLRTLREISGEDCVRELSAALTDVVFAVMMVPEGAINSPYTDCQDAAALASEFTRRMKEAKRN